MADCVFNSAYFFENETYLELHENIYNPRKRKVVSKFHRFLRENLKELGFKPITGKWEQYQFTFKDRSKQINVTHKKDGVYVIAEDTDIAQAVVEKNNGDKFEHLMDRIMDALEVVECQLFGMKNNNKLDSTSLEPIDMDVSDTGTNGEETSDGLPITETDDEEDLVVENEEMTVHDNDIVQRGKAVKTTRRSMRLRNANKTKLAIDVGNQSSDGETTASSDIPNLIPLYRNKKSLQNGEQPKTRRWKRKFIQQWIKGGYVAAIHLAEEHGMEESEINDLIEHCYSTGY